MHDSPSKLERPRVGYVLKKYPRLSETFILNELLGHQEAGLDTSVFSLRLPDEGKFHREVADFDGEVTYLPSGKGPAQVEAFALLSETLDVERVVAEVADYIRLLPDHARSSVLAQGVLLAQAAKQRGVQHFHAHFMTVAAHTACVASLLTGISFTVTAHAKDIFRHTINRELFQATAERATGIITVCDYNLNLLKSGLLEGSPARVLRIYNGLPISALSVPSGPREDGLILGVGRLVEKKGFQILLQATRLLLDQGHSVRVVLLGDGDQKEKLLAEHERLGLGDAVTFRGAAGREEVLQWMARAQVLAAPCVTGGDGNRDALPTVLIEALAMGLPSVTTPVSGIPEIVIDGEQGLIVPENDPVAVAQAIARLMMDRDLWAACAASGPSRAQVKFDRSETLPQLLAEFVGSRAAMAQRKNP